MVEVQTMQPPLVMKPDYTSYAEYLESRGWRREQLTLDENNTNLVTRQTVAAGATNWIIDIRVPAGQKVSIMGTQQIPRGADARTAHALRIRAADSTDAEIGLFTKMRITKEKSSEAIVQLARPYYADINLTKQTGTNPQLKTDLEWYRFKQGIELNGEQRFRLYAVAPNLAVNAGNVTFALDCDLWTRED